MSPFANDLRFCREAAGLSLSAAARAASITKAHLHDMESGRARNPCISTLAGLAKAYGQEIGWMAERAALSLSSEVPSISPSEASACTPATDEDQNLPDTPVNADKPEGGGA